MPPSSTGRRHAIGAGTGSDAGSESGMGTGTGTGSAGSSIELTAVRQAKHDPRQGLAEAPAALSRSSAAAPSAGMMTRSTTRGTTSKSKSKSDLKSSGFLSKMEFGAFARKTIGICFILGTVTLWTVSNFITSFIFSDQTYNKPFFLVYGTNIAFALNTIPFFLKYLTRRGISGLQDDVGRAWGSAADDLAKYSYRYSNRPARTRPHDYEPLDASPSSDDECEEYDNLHGGNGNGIRDNSDHDREAGGGQRYQRQGEMSMREVAVVAFEMTFPWLLSDYLASACLAYTSVASVTILSSTSSIWTLIFGVATRVESFSLHKLASVVASIIGIIIISSIDLSGGDNNGSNDNNSNFSGIGSGSGGPGPGPGSGADASWGSFPHKSWSQIALGDAMAFLGAIIYGFTTVRLKKCVVSDSGNDMQLVLALAGLFTLLFTWPLFFLLHWTGIETFELPSTGQIWAIFAFNSISGFFGDVFWGYSLLLISPLVVTLGLSMTIPVSLVGEMVQYGQYASLVYWVGALVVVLSFVFVSFHRDDNDDDDDDDGSRQGRGRRTEHDRSTGAVDSSI